MIEPGHEASQAPLPLVLIGPHTCPAHQKKPRLADGAPLFHALLSEETIASGIIRPAEERLARDVVREASEINPNAVASCRGKTREEARGILEGIFLKA